MTKLCVAGLAALVTVTACDGLKEAMTAHVDVAARAGSQELSVQRLADLMGKSQIPLRKDVAQQIAEVWVNYQLAAKASANSETFKDTTVLDKAMSPVFARSRQDKWYQVVSKSWKIDTTNLEQHFNSGELLAASHILFQVPQGQKPTGSDSIKRKAESVLKQTNAANFAAMAKKYGSDATKDQGGSLGVFPPAKMIAEFSKAVTALKPGEIGPLVQTQFGYHIVRRNTYAESKDAFRAVWDTLQRQKAESAYVANVEKSGNIQVKPTAAKTVKDVAADVSAHTDDRTVIATSVMGNYTAGQVAQVITSSPSPDQLRSQIQQAQDSLIPYFIRSVVRNELFLRQADSAKVKLDSSEVSSIRQAFRMMEMNVWAGLHVLPEQLVDSAKTVAEKERLAATRIDTYLDRLLQQQEQFVDVQSPLASALRDRYNGKVYSAGLDRAVQAAQKIRAVSDSARAARQPKSAVPMPPAPADTSKPPAGAKKG
jgi:peptidyl-prolyl cis-trans isomerase D